MSLLSLYDQALPKLERLGRWLVWGRRRLADEIAADLRLASAQAGEQEQALATAQQSLERIKSGFVALREQHGLATQHHEQSAASLQRIEQDYAQLRERNSLVVQLLSVAPPENPGLDLLRELIDKEYLPFANDEQSLAEEAQALLLLQGVVEELRLMTGFPGIFGKAVLAIAGSFSAGKSAFVNSFIADSKLHLAVGITPVTAIPAYVVQAARPAIWAHGANGGAVTLQAQTYRHITHDYIKALGFNLKQIMPALSIGLPLDDALFAHLCLIDTPGYNPAPDQGYSNEDGATARRFVATANALLWVIGVDANGTLSASDLHFIRSLALGQRELYVVVNKADLRPQADLDAILDAVDDVLADEDIAVVGISAYSAVHRREYCSRRLSLTDFLRRQNRPSSSRANITGTINRVFDMYQQAIHADLARSEQIAVTFKSIQLDVLQAGDKVLDGQLIERFDAIKQHFDTTSLQELAARAQMIRARLLAAAEAALDAIDAGQPARVAPA